MNKSSFAPETVSIFQSALQFIATNIITPGAGIINSNILYMHILCAPNYEHFFLDSPYKSSFTLLLLSSTLVSRPSKIQHRFRETGSVNDLLFHTKLILESVNEPRRRTRIIVNMSVIVFLPTIKCFRFILT